MCPHRIAVWWLVTLFTEQGMVVEAQGVKRVWRQRLLPWHRWLRNRCLSLAAEHRRAMLAGVAVISSALQYWRPDV